ncbi:WD40 repeat domain-containing protein [Robiginitalea sp. SC105]|uniref:WD40 repeat domain-containing protein n=1 Tax=Robiginitalea sp. SC105 TaxID=2762332 RepID=UPI00163A83C6|nr:hypothetical protein [Robiginitalea sp. SC105]MBC2838601.1 hypothetical protein [Robiginitalea sp. SC105]
MGRPMKASSLNSSRMAQKKSLMKSSNYSVFIALLSIILAGCKQEIEIRESAFTAVNPLSYTDVIFKSERDTVLVATFSGRITERIRGQQKEKLLINLQNEIYSLAYEPQNQLLYASTLQSGIVVIDATKNTVIDRLPVEGSWISNIYLSKNGEVLAGLTAHRQNYIRDLKKDQPIPVPEKISNYRISGLDEQGAIILKGNGKFVFWDAQTDQFGKELTGSGKLTDVDGSGNMLFLNNKEFQFYNAKADSLSFVKHHPDWPYYYKEQDTLLRIPIQLALTDGKLTDRYIFTAGVDRSIRKWNKMDGQHLGDITEHRATISAMDCSPDKSQLVSVDLKGGILFSEIDQE